MKATAWITLAVAVGLVGCTKVLHRADGTHDVPRQVGEANVFGTDQFAMHLERCKTRVHHAIGSDEYLNCEPITNYKFASSPSGGPGVIAALFQSLGFGLGLAHSGASTNVTQSGSQSVDASTNIKASTIFSKTP